MNQLKDIKPLVIIDENSFIYFLIALIIVLLIIGFSYWKIAKYRRNDDKKRAIKHLKNLDFSNSKTVAYDFKIYAEKLCNEDNQKQFEYLNNELERYKYKPQVGELKAELIQKIKAFINV